MEFYSVEYWQENWETLMDRVENGETIGVENDKGERAVTVSYTHLTLPTILLV